MANPNCEQTGKSIGTNNVSQEYENIESDRSTLEGAVAHSRAIHSTNDT